MQFKSSANIRNYGRCQTPCYSKSHPQTQPLDGYINTYPSNRFHIGIDPIIGLVPGAGDLISTAFSAYIIFLATRFGIPRQDLAKMIFNVGLETVVGTVPFVGDLFDAFYKSNIRNLAILEQHLTVVEPERKKVSDELYSRKFSEV